MYGTAKFLSFVESKSHNIHAYYILLHNMVHGCFELKAAE
jgi:hypothetical protein